MNKFNFFEINDSTAFMNGDKFESKNEVSQYFTVENIINMCDECSISQEVLTLWAESVIAEKNHCNF